MPVSEIKIKDLSTLLEKAVSIARDCQDGFLWYRGVHCATYSLIPKIMRDKKSSEEVFEREKRLLTRFRQRSMAYWPSGYPQDDWEHLFAMQHFGMPTRLIDWSENLFVAAYFAFESIVGSHSHDGDCYPAIWCIDPVTWNRATPPLSEYGENIQVLTTADQELEAYRPETVRRRMKTPVAIFGAHNSDRIVAQRGTFFVWGNDTRPLEDFADESNCTLWKLVMTQPREELAQELRLLGFGETMVFPELPSLAIELSRTEGWRDK